MLFFLSGATGLVYEVLWTRQLALIFGVTTYAISTVLATYMGGLALGSWLVGRTADRSRNPLLLYAILEIAIGVYALVVPLLFELLRPLYISLAHLELSYPVFSLARSLMAAAALLLPTTLMGGTFPVLVRLWVQYGGGVQRGTGVLYFTNVAGAIVGCATAGFLLLESLGLSGTNRLAAFTNIALGLVAALLARDQATRARAAEAATPGVESSQTPFLSPGATKLLLFCAGLSGFVSLAAQVLWSRALLRYLYNSTYAFTAMLSVFLVGIAVGSAVYTGLLARRRRPLLWLAMLQAGAAGGLIASVAIFPRVRDFTTWYFESEIVPDFETAVVTMLLRAAIILLPPVIFLGAIFPLVTGLYAGSREDVGHSIGRVYAINTFGAILGSVGCAFVLIPFLGMWGTHKLLVLACLAGAGATLATAMTTAGARAAVAMVTVAAVFAAEAAAPENVFRSTFLARGEEGLVFYAEGPTDTVGVSEFFGQRTIVYEDQRGTASTASYGVNLFFGHLPMLLHQGTPKKVLHVCFGVGNSLSAVATHEELERVDSVELSPHVLDAGRLFWTNDGAVDHPKVRHIIDDGRNYLMTTSEVYDVILLEPPETFTAGVINLYTREFYSNAIERLAPDGLMMQWIPTANGTIDEEKEMFRAFSDVFPHVTTWWQLGSGCALLIGTKQPLTIDYQRLQRHMQEGRVPQDMALSQVRDADHLLSMFVFDEAGYAEFVKDARPTTDDHTVLDFSMPRYLGSGFGLGQFNTKVRTVGENPFLLANRRRAEYFSKKRSVIPLLVNLGEEDPEQITRRIESYRDFPFLPRFLLEPEWKRMRESGELLPPVPESEAR